MTTAKFIYRNNIKGTTVRPSYYAFWNEEEKRVITRDFAWKENYQYQKQESDPNRDLESSYNVYIFSQHSSNTQREFPISADMFPNFPCAYPGEKRTINLQPIFFKSDNSDPAPTGKRWNKFLNMARVIWGKLGVTFRELPPIMHIDAYLKKATSASTMSSARGPLRE